MWTALNNDTTAASSITATTHHRQTMLLGPLGLIPIQAFKAHVATRPQPAVLSRLFGGLIHRHIQQHVSTQPARGIPVAVAPRTKSPVGTLLCSDITVNVTIFGIECVGHVICETLCCSLSNSPDTT